MVETINFKELNIDKENDYVRYNDELHKYWTKDNLQCISVTTLIHKFTNFDEDFWSSYKTIEKMVGEEEFKKVKSNLTLSKSINAIKEAKILLDIDEDDFIENKEALLKEWEEKRETSCIRGTAIHKAHELEHLAGTTKELKSLKLGGKFNTNITNKIVAGEQNVYPELLLSRISDDGELRVAGQADLIIIDGLDVYVLDYKTNKKIDMKSFYDPRLKKSAKLKYPLNNLDDCNFMHYSLQLSTYAWMIEKLDSRFNIKKLMLIHIDHSDIITEYECQYLKSDVERMLAYYKKQLTHDKFKESRQKISF